MRRLASRILHSLLYLRDRLLSAVAGIYLRDLLPQAKFSQPQDCYKAPPLISVPRDHVLILVPCKDVARFLPTLEKNLLALSYDKSLISLGFVEDGSQDNTYAGLQDFQARNAAHFAAVYLDRRATREGGARHSRRWKAQLQASRRVQIAAARNYLLKFLQPEHKWVLWVDADVLSWEADCLEQLLKFNRKILVPHCIREDNGRTFDLNSFKYLDDKPRNWQTYVIDGILQPPRSFGRLYLEDLLEYDLVSLDGVGATMLLVNADLHRQGLIYPTEIYHKHLETEGLAFMARDLGQEVWGAPKITITHPMY